MSNIGKRVLKIIAWAIGILLMLVVALVLYVQATWDAKDPRSTRDLHAPSDSATIARGEYIFKYQAQCWGCHNGTTRDTAAIAAGRFAPPVGGQLFDLTNVGPGFGKWYSRNLTPDMETGLGGWTD